MTELVIEGKLAALKKGTSFDYIVENRLFTDADAFSLSIELPLKDCPQNRAIYGYITRRDISASSTAKSAVLRCGSWQKSGVVTIVETTETSVKVQFLEGQSAANYASVLSETYINEVSLPYPDAATATEAMCLANAQKDISSATPQEYLALPWYNEYSGKIQNDVQYVGIAQTAVPSSLYHPFAVTNVSYQIYLLPLVKKLLTAVNYTYDLSAWEQSSWKYLMVFNALPAVWKLRNFNRPLPHWTISELLTQIENLMGVSFEIDDAKKKVTMKTISSYHQQTVQISNVVDEYKAESNEDGVEYIGNRPAVYADCDYADWKMLSCQDKIDSDLMDLIDNTKTYEQVWTGLCKNISYNTAEIVEGVTTNNVWARFGLRQYHAVYKTTDTDEYLIRRNVRKRYTTSQDGSAVFNEEMLGLITKINTFGNPYQRESNFELKIVPARIDNVTKFETSAQWEWNDMSLHMVVLNCGTIDENYESPSSPVAHTEEEFLALKSKTEEMLFDEKAELTEFFDKLYVGFWRHEFANCMEDNGTSDAFESKYNQVPVLDHYKCPWFGWMNYWVAATRQGRQDTGMTLSRKEIEGARTRVNPERKVTVKWLSDEIPNVTSVFIIDNKRYLCERIKTQFSEDGRSQMLEGEFWEFAYSQD